MNAQQVVPNNHFPSNTPTTINFLSFPINYCAIRYVLTEDMEVIVIRDDTSLVAHLINIDILWDKHGYVGCNFLCHFKNPDGKNSQGV